MEDKTQRIGIGGLDMRPRCNGLRSLAKIVEGEELRSAIESEPRPTPIGLSSCCFARIVPNEAGTGIMCQHCGGAQ